MTFSILRSFKEHQAKRNDRIKPYESPDDEHLVWMKDTHKRTGWGGKGGNCPPKMFEYFVIRATDPQRFGQKEFSKLDKISCLFPNQT